MAIEKLSEFAKDGQKNTDDLNLTDGFPVSKKPARQWFNWLFNTLTSKVNEIIDADFIPKTDIVNNLTTDDAKKPVSAKQAKALQDTKLGKTENAASATNCSRSVIAGNGLSGGGALTSNSTVTLGTPGNITATSTNSVTETSHTHNLDVNSLPFLGTGINKRKSIISGTTYTNTGNRPIFVTCSMSGSSSIAASATLDGRMIFSTNSSNQFSQSFVVGVGVSYSFTGNALVCEEYS